MNIREQILSQAKLKTEPVHAFGQDLLVKELNGCERDAFEASLSKIVGKTVSPNLKNIRAKLVTKTLCDLEGNRIFEDADVDAVGNLPASELDKVFAISQVLSGLKQEDIEELTKNS